MIKGTKKFYVLHKLETKEVNVDFMICRCSDMKHIMGFYSRKFVTIQEDVRIFLIAA